MINGTLDILKNIIDVEMEMPQGRVFAYNATQDLPQDKNMFIVLQYMARTPYYNNAKEISTENGLQEYQSMGMIEDVLISVASQSIEARERCYEVFLALRSQYSQKMQEKYKIHISSTGDCLDASFLEATARLNRFDIRCTVTRSYSKIKDIDYYDKFSFETWVGHQDGNIIKDNFKIGE